MQKNYVYKSVALHIAVVLLCVFDIPFLGSKRNFDEHAADYGRFGERKNF